MAPGESEIPLSIRSRIIKMSEKGYSYRKIASVIGRSFSGVRNVIKRYEATRKIDNEARSGRPRILTVRERRDVVRLSDKNPFMSAPMIAEHIASYCNKTVHPQNIRRILHSSNIFGRSPRKKPLISEANRVKRLNFAKEYVNKPDSFWKTVIFSDESKFNLFGSDGKKYVWRKPNTELQTKNLRPTVKHGGGNVLVWGCMASGGVGNLTFIEGIMNAECYINVLRHNLKDSARKLGLENTFYFQQDNDPKHTAAKTREWLLYNAPRRLMTPPPPQSPDINPIENLWNKLDVEVRKRTIRNKNQFKQVLQEVWLQISPQVTENLVQSMPRRLQAVIDAKGMHTKY